MNIPREIALEIFGLTEDFDEDELKSCYTNLSKIIHPDSGGDEKLFDFVTECKKVLENNTDNTSNNNTDKEEKQNTDPKKGTAISVTQLQRIYFNNLPLYAKKLNMKLIYTDIELCLIPIENENDRWNSKLCLTDSFEAFWIRDSVSFETVVKIPEELKKYNKFKVDLLYNGKKIKFKVSRRKRTYSYIDKVVRFNTYIDLAFVWDY